ncbi:NusA-like transcription termination signal-binding factor [Methanoplanus sp. FWC-SCC4]|uniref:Probable transcription termination protein NusA n=1 Tax=Methanochimaera problematica TaxID=2609417 RepID=A0AA97FBF5_9EURY|nr:NusA-like transcription termination signal-binding factor [Methanoplanus sp. FWC-SCC4]WOF15807.1 NusA-like transcription termination signal-binding factor [Methanoplanus sp. FWC-SCC4]
MGEIVLNEQSLQLMKQFEDITGAGSRDCIVDERNERLIFVINPGDMGRAIGKQGASIKKASEELGKKIEVVEFSNDAEQFIKNCFLPARVISVEITENEEGEYIANVDVEEEDRGIAIGKGGKNIFKANKLAERQHDIVNVQIITEETL